MRRKNSTKVDAANCRLRMRVREMLPLAGFILILSIMRLHTFSEPIERDVGCYTAIAWEIVHGGSIFDGFLFDQKPPLVHWTWALSLWISGFGPLAIYVTNVACGIAMLLAIFYAVTSVAPPVWGLWAAAMWLVVSGNLGIEANQPNTEAFINPLIAAAIGALARINCMQSQGSNALLSLIAGLCFAAASLYKQVMVVVPCAVCVLCLLFPWKGRTRSKAVLDWLIIAGVGLISWGLLVGYFWATGRLSNMFLALVKFNQFYSESNGANSGGAIGNVITSFSPNALFPRRIWFFTPFVLLTVSGAWLAFNAKARHLCVLLLGLLVGTHIAIALPGRFYPHYYQLWYPFLAIGAGWGLSFFATKWQHSRVYAHLAAGVATLVLLIVELPNYLHLNAVEWSRKKYGDIFVRTDEIGHWLTTVLREGERFFQYGSEPQLYIKTGQRTPSVPIDYFVGEGPMAKMLTRQMMDDLNAVKPDLILLEKWARISEGRELIAWLQEHYAEAPGVGLYDPFYVLCLRGSNLEARLRESASKR